MSSITKYFFTFFVFLFVSLVFITYDVLSQDKQKQNSIEAFSAISTLPNTFISTSQFESRYKEYKDARYRFSDTQNKINYMDFSRR